MSNLSVHACPLASDSKAACVRHHRYSRVNSQAHVSVMHVTRVCARVTSARSTHERVSIASIPRPLPPRKKAESLGTRLARPPRVNLVHTFECEHVRVRVLACDSCATREGCQVACEWHCTHVPHPATEEWGNIQPSQTLNIWTFLTTQYHMQATLSIRTPTWTSS